MNNKPYFDNVYIYGNLYLDKVLLEYDFFIFYIKKITKANFLYVIVMKQKNGSHG